MRCWAQCHGNPTACKTPPLCSACASMTVLGGCLGVRWWQRFWEQRVSVTPVFTSAPISAHPGCHHISVFLHFRWFLLILQQQVFVQIQAKVLGSKNVNAFLSAAYLISNLSLCSNMLLNSINVHLASSVIGFAPHTRCVSEEIHLQ